MKRKSLLLISLVLITVVMCSSFSFCFVNVPIKSISLNKATMIIDIGESYKLVARISPSNATNKTLKWTSSNSSVVSVDKTGKLKALKAGKVTITAESSDRKVTVKCVVTVVKPNASVVTIQYMHNWDDWDSKVYDKMRDDRIKKYIDDKLNIKLEYKAVWTDYNSKMRLALSTGQGPDLMLSFPNDPDFKKAVEEDLLVDIGGIVAKSPERYKALNIAINDPVWKMFNEIITGSAERNPGIYGYMAGYNAIGGIAFNANYMKKLGLSLPKTTDEFIAMLRKFRDGDPDGNGKQDTIPFSWLQQKGTCPIMASDFNVIFGSTYGVSTNSYLQDKNGKWYDPSYTDKMKNAVKQYAAWYKEGLFDKEQMTKEYYANGDDFALGKAASTSLSLPVYGQYTWLFDKVKANKPDATPKDIVQLEEPLKGPEGLEKSNVIPGNLSFIHIIPKYTKNPERVVDLCNFMLSDEGQMLWGYGVKGIHYKIDSKGNIVRNLDEYRKEVQIYWPACGTRLEYPNWYVYSTGATQGVLQMEKAGSWWNAFDNVVIPMMEATDVLTGGVSPQKAYAKGVEAKMKPALVNVLPPYMILINWSTAENKLYRKCFDIKSKWFSEFYMGQKDIDKDWNAFVNEYKDAGAVELEDAYNEKVKNMKRIYLKYGK